MSSKAQAIALCALLLASCSKKEQPASSASPSASAMAEPSLSASASASAEAPAPPEPPPVRTPEQLLDEHRDKLDSLVNDGKYDEVCQGAPWLNQAICKWVAARAAGKAAGRPDGEVFRAFFAKEHWKQVHGRILSIDGLDGLEVVVSGYRNHCILELIDTQYSTTGGFSLWVQEQPETREIQLNSGSFAHWVVLEEATLAKALMTLARSGGGIESMGMAKDVMATFARYRTYAERKGETLAVPGADPAPAASATASASSAPSAPPTPPTPAATTVAVKANAPAAPAKNPRARSACIASCVAKCSDNPVCERSCAGKCN